MGKRNKGENRQQARKTFNKTKFGKFTGKKNSTINKNSNSSTNPDRKIKEGSEGFFRDKATIKRLRMYKDKPDNSARNIRPDKPARIEPSKTWFGNTRTIDQKSLENLRREMENKSHESHSLLLKKRKIPQSLITVPKPTNNIMKLQQSFKDTFGPGSRRRKPNLKAYTMEEYANNSEQLLVDYNSSADIDLTKLLDIDKDTGSGKYMTAGQSRRIFGELYKVIDSSDVICSIIDARDPIGTRSFYVENFIKKNCPHKHLILILNKCDLVPTWATVK